MSRVIAICSVTVISLTLPAHAGEKVVLRPDVPEKICPIERITVEARDGRQTFALVRRPPGEGPFPAIVFLHGSLAPYPEKRLRLEALSAATHTRFLAAGYVTVTGTHRNRNQDPQAPAYLDCVAVVEYAKKLPEVDPKSVVVMGGSGGGSLALEVAGETQVAAIAAGEPATMLFTGMLNKNTPRADPRLFRGNTDTKEMLADPHKFYTPELRRFTREKMRRISCPILIAHGDVYPGLLEMNREILLAELNSVGRNAEMVIYPNQPHGFYFGRTRDQEAAKKFFQDCDAFFRRHIVTQPVALDASLIRYVPANPVP